MKRTLRLCFFLSLTVPVAFSSCARRTTPAAPATTTTAPAPAPATPAPAAPLQRTAARDLAAVMAEELGLTGDQQSQIREMLRNTVQQVNAARSQYAGDQTALRSALMRINSESEGQLRQVLTAEQFTQYQAKRTAIQAKMKARKEGTEK